MRFEFKSGLKKASKFHAKFNNGKPVPLYVMYGRILKETDKCYYIEVEGRPEETDNCIHCNRKLTDDVSRLYGLGPTCGKKYGIRGIDDKNILDKYDSIRGSLSGITWRGLVPKEDVKIRAEYKTTIVFRYKNQQYRVTTSDKKKLEDIKEKSDLIISETQTEVY